MLWPEQRGVLGFSWWPPACKALYSSRLRSKQRSYASLRLASSTSLGYLVAQAGAERLPLQVVDHTVALQIAEDAVVADQVKAVMDFFEGTAGAGGGG